MNTITKEQRLAIYSRAGELLKTMSREEATRTLIRERGISKERARNAVWHAEATERGRVYRLKGNGL